MIGKTKFNKKSSYYLGVRAALPICFGYMPLGFAFGVVAQKSGFSPFEVALLSIFVFAGSGQFIAASMFATGASIFSIVLTTFIINLRHLMMSSALSVYIKNRSLKFLSIFAHQITDETFAINLNEFSKDSNWRPQDAIVVNHIAHFFWILSCVTGSILGEIIKPGAYGINYVLTAMFIGLIAFQLKNSYFILAAILSGILAIFFSMIFSGNIYIILSSIITTTIMFFIKK